MSRSVTFEDLDAKIDKLGETAFALRERAQRAEAALKRVESERDAAFEALKPFAEVADRYSESSPDYNHVHSGVAITVGMCRRAREALSKAEGNTAPRASETPSEKSGK
jgi:hypothetical protein